MGKSGMRKRDLSAAGKPADANLAKTLLKMIAVGVAGGAALIAAGKRSGEEIEKKFEETQEGFDGVQAESGEIHENSELEENVEKGCSDE